MFDRFTVGVVAKTYGCVAAVRFLPFTAAFVLPAGFGLRGHTQSGTLLGYRKLSQKKKGTALKEAAFDFETQTHTRTHTSFSSFSRLLFVSPTLFFYFFRNAAQTHPERHFFHARSRTIENNFLLLGGGIQHTRTLIGRGK